MMTADSIYKKLGTGHRKSAYPEAKIEPVIAALDEAVRGNVPWGMSRPARTIADLAYSGHILVQFNGSRAPSVQSCVGCRALTSNAWLVLPAGFKVAACCGDCVADRVEQEWSSLGWAIFHRFRGSVVYQLSGENVA